MATKKKNPEVIESKLKDVMQWCRSQKELRVEHQDSFDKGVLYSADSILRILES